ncbi:MAG: hypothetical protein HYY21_11650 [Candidatus Tectomicrobia bacterium]|nr:hypothetical protein [Candidatus Tectomicrobia bacterium]
MDRWTKTALWLIALALWGLLLRPLVLPDTAGAARETVNVNIAEVGGSKLSFNGPIPVAPVRSP